MYIILYMGTVVLSLENKTFSWSDHKNQENIKKHGVSFQEAVPVFLDPYLIIQYDQAHSTMEEVRWKGIGVLNNVLLLVIIFTEVQENEVWLISAREASKKEQEDYRENISRIFGA